MNEVVSEVKDMDALMEEIVNVDHVVQDEVRDEEEVVVEGDSASD